MARTAAARSQRRLQEASIMAWIVVMCGGGCQNVRARPDGGLSVSYPGHVEDQRHCNVVPSDLQLAEEIYNLGCIQTPYPLSTSSFPRRSLKPPGSR
jgi:hypothetical protein